MFGNFSRNLWFCFFVLIVIVPHVLSDAAIRGSGASQDQMVAAAVPGVIETESMNDSSFIEQEEIWNDKDSMAFNQNEVFNDSMIPLLMDHEYTLGHDQPSIQDPAGLLMGSDLHRSFHHRPTTFGYASHMGPRHIPHDLHHEHCGAPSDFFRMFHHDEGRGGSRPFRHSMGGHSMGGDHFGTRTSTKKFGGCDANPMTEGSASCPLLDEIFSGHFHGHHEGPSFFFETFYAGRMGSFHQSSMDVSEHIWIIEGRSLIENGTKIGIPEPLGFVTLSLSEASTETVTARYHLNNDVDFILTPIYEQEILNELTESTSGDGGSTNQTGVPRGQKTWKAEVTSKTTLQGTPTELLIESKLEELFLHGIIRTEYIEAMNFPKLIISNGLNSSVHLIPLPSIFTPLTSVSDLYQPEGEWMTVFKDNSTNDALEVALSLIHIGSHDAFVLFLDGMNKHHALAWIKQNGVLTLAPISSTALTPDNEVLGKLESQLISILSHSTHVMVHPTKSGVNEITPTLTFSSPFSSIDFFRPEYAHRGHPELPISYWHWIPQSARTSNIDVPATGDSLTTSQVPVLLALHKSGPAYMLDVYVASSETSATKLRALYLPTGRRESSSLRSVSIEPVSTISLESVSIDMSSTTSEIQQFIQRALNDFESIEIDGNGSFLTLVGPNTSLSFSAAAVPSPGLWVMEPSLSHSADPKGLAVLEGSERPKLLLQREGSRFRAHLFSMKNEIHEFVIRNHAVSPAELDWRVSQLVKRENEGSNTIIDAILKDGIRVEMGTQLGHNQNKQPKHAMKSISLILTDGNQHIVFVHPADLTKQMAGDWELLSATMAGIQLPTMRSSYFVDNVTLPISMRLIPAGVGELVGEIRTSELVLLRMEEVFTVPDQEVDQPIDSQLVTPTTWHLKASRQAKRSSRPSKQFPAVSNGHTTGNDLVLTKTENDGIESFLNSISQCIPWKSQLKGVRMTLQCGNIETEFVKVLNRRIRHHIEGEWLVEFVTLPASMDANPRDSDSDDIFTESIGTLALHHPGSPPLVIELQLQETLPKDIQDHTGTEWDPMAITSYMGGVYLGQDMKQDHIGEFVMIVNPFGSIQIGQLNFEENMQSISGGNESVHQLIDVLATFLNSIEANTPPMFLEVVHSEIIVTDGDSMLAMSRTPQFYRNSRHYKVNTVSHQELADKITLNVTMEMLTKVRRRLEAALFLEDLLTAEESV